MYNTENRSNQENNLQFSNLFINHHQNWQGNFNNVSFDAEQIKLKLRNLEKPCYIVRNEGIIGITNEGNLSHVNNGKTAQMEMLMAVPPLAIQQLGDTSFLDFYGVKYAYMTGAMAQGIASEEMV
ncbi:MAG: 2-nitropropane dioxygenase, partial [Sphaerospermopsis kisseleviana]